ncbi:3D domain-containing protein [Metabacillus sp. RGM 3146]|uniref:3D domain-containing protein n=1 Tax=Metabacillus sp. RGM 3146 TaxID=3401092 RepID=UPI003B9A0DAB
MRKLIATTALGLSMLIATPAFAYEVQSGDTMGNIAKESNLTLQELSKANPQIKDIDLIYVGQELRLPGTKSVKGPVKKEEKDSKTITVESSAYTASCAGCSGITRTGIDLRNNPNQKVIAVDPAVIPLGSKVYVPGYGHAVAGDTGGAINGKRIDIFMPNRSDALSYGRRTIEIKVVK